MPPKKGEKETLPDQDRRESSSIDVSHMHSQITCMQTRKNKKKNKKQKTKNKKNLLRTGLGEF